MTFSILVILLLTLPGVLMIVLKIRLSSRQRSLAQPETALIPVDAVALGNLLHDGEDTFLRRNLGPQQYRHIKRKRVRAAQEYVWNISRNALILSRVAGLALDFTRPEIHRTVHKLSPVIWWPSIWLLPT